MFTFIRITSEKGYVLKGEVYTEGLGIHIHNVTQYDNIQ